MSRYSCARIKFDRRGPSNIPPSMAGYSLQFINIPTMELDQFAQWIDRELCLGRPATIRRIYPSTSGREYQMDARVDFSYWYKTQSTMQLANHIEKEYVDDCSRMELTHIRLPGQRHLQNIVVRPLRSPLPDHRSRQPLVLGAEDWSSLYIPYLSEELRWNGNEVVDERVLTHLLDVELGIGRVKRIDFIERAVQPGMAGVRSAFVHFDCWYDNRDAQMLRATLMKRGSVQLSGAGDLYPNFTRVSDGQTQFITLKINRTPIPEATEADVLNVHQLAVAKRALEQQLANAMLSIRQLEMQLAAAHMESETYRKTIRNLETENATLCSHLMEEGNSTIYTEVSRSNSAEFDMMSAPILTMSDLEV